MEQQIISRFNDAMYPFKKPGEISEVCVEQENALDSNFGNFLPQNIEMIRCDFAGCDAPVWHRARSDSGAGRV
jgi:hypothetical protein